MKASSTQIVTAATAVLSVTGAYAFAPVNTRATLALGTMEYIGCYSSSTGLTFNNTWNFQTQGYCQPFCVGDNQQYVLGLTGGDECWCGMELPPADKLVSNSSCLQGCNGYGADPCGSKDGKFFTVWTSGVVDIDQIANASDVTSTSSTASATASSTTVATPYVTTMGTTVVTVTASAQTAVDSEAASKKHSKANTAGIIAGVVVGIVLIGAIAGGAFLFLRHRRRKEIEDEYQRNANINNFVGNGKPPGSSAGFSNVTDTRLDHSALQRRMSDGSIADNEDYSRKILRVTNA